MVLLPSLSFPVAELVKITGIDHYEERLLCVILLLARPDLRIVYLTSQPVDPAIVDYHLGFLPDPGDARRRLHLVAVGEAGPRPLTQKLLDHPDVLTRVRELVDGDPGAALLPFNVTPAEWALARALGLVLDGPGADLVALGSKTGSRRVARRAGVAVLEGEEDLGSQAAVAAALGRLHRRRPRAAQAVIKLNHGFSGQGNALVDLAAVEPLSPGSTTFCAAGESWSTYATKIADEGAIVEEVAPSPLASPSAQVRINPDGGVHVVSTHDQVLGGPGNQVYLGCRFPAEAGYRTAIAEAAVAVGRVLAGDGVVGPFGVDFLVLDGPTGARGSPKVVLSEINLRLGGTTHPFWMARLATGGRYHPGTGELLVDGRPRCYVATDNLRAPGLVGWSPAQAVEAVTAAGLAYDAASATGVTLHLLGALASHGKLGATCIAEDLAGAAARSEALSALLAGVGRVRSSSSPS
jgi:hypothetical protein